VAYKASPGQLVLPLLEMRASCPLCGLPAAILGQYSPLWPWGVCRDCSLAEPYPVEVFEVSEKSKDRSGLRIQNADYALLERRVSLDNLIRNRVKGAPVFAPYKINITLRQLRNGIRYDRSLQYASWHYKAAILARYEQLELPYCHRCMKVTDEPRDAMGYCPRCAAMNGVESMWRHKGIYGDADDETILDKLFRAFPEWFDCGVLPDYWFNLMKEAKVQHAIEG
jgi:hypothetical protein